MGTLRVPFGFNFTCMDFNKELVTESISIYRDNGDLISPYMVIESWGKDLIGINIETIRQSYNFTCYIYGLE